MFKLKNLSFKKELKEKFLSDLLAFALVILFLGAIDITRFMNKGIMSFLFIFFSYLLVYYILEKSFMLILGKKNVIVGFGSYLIVAIVVATINTFIL